MTTIVIVAAVIGFVVLAAVRGRRLGRAAVRRCRHLLRRERHDLDVAMTRGLPRRKRTPMDLPRCDACHEVLTDIAERRQHPETHQ